MGKRRRIKHSVTFEERIASEARRLKAAAELLPPGQSRDELLKKASQAEAALEMIHLLKPVSSE
ncbi:hypothetical protein JQ580_28375 [Bradyrhizobium japonicum]|uniref:hypothetical protein n=1 Tax=Bradyrhizobium japonicum TaxID=375 RepID=UPI001BAC2FA9|nr:hypothetical protein [Bradyrhizobium japonicum]MBR0994632.1 hypothetical protein [Bradyrhizobium japonicum]